MPSVDLHCTWEQNGHLLLHDWLLPLLNFHLLVTLFFIRPQTHWPFAIAQRPRQMTAQELSACRFYCQECFPLAFLWPVSLQAQSIHNFLTEAFLVTNSDK